ncbi:hypothetical protein CXG81DRAFT_25250 [Caulochytrium protostelioides]|uniref:Uncharacterized protein n=1 Tax=Caulochytrium protostelioides TaxID=1555241 RepID=A0A4P9X9R6_9FUNG|nr:hypothetical protein CXG81DRAFT_25250 [Caulochytrium protostelioides]|eukprot:RKP02094.1 hypothetical protein CXG81DRAFT_25250 [Caulochytrium protostelioides]
MSADIQQLEGLLHAFFSSATPADRKRQINADLAKWKTQERSLEHATHVLAHACHAYRRQQEDAAGSALLAQLGGAHAAHSSPGSPASPASSPSPAPPSDTLQWFALTVYDEQFAAWPAPQKAAAFAFLWDVVAALGAGGSAMVVNKARHVLVRVVRSHGREAWDAHFARLREEARHRPLLGLRLLKATLEEFAAPRDGVLRADEQAALDQCLAAHADTSFALVEPALAAAWEAIAHAARSPPASAATAAAAASPVLRSPSPSHAGSASPHGPMTHSDTFAPASPVLSPNSATGPALGLSPDGSLASSPRHDAFPSDAVGGPRGSGLAARAAAGAVLDPATEARLYEALEITFQLCQTLPLAVLQQHAATVGRLADFGQLAGVRHAGRSFDLASLALSSLAEITGRRLVPDDTVAFVEWALARQLQVGTTYLADASRPQGRVLGSEGVVDHLLFQRKMLDAVRPMVAMHVARFAPSAMQDVLVFLYHLTAFSFRCFDPAGHFRRPISGDPDDALDGETADDGRNGHPDEEEDDEDDDDEATEVLVAALGVWEAAFSALENLQRDRHPQAAARIEAASPAALALAQMILDRVQLASTPPGGLLHAMLTTAAAVEPAAAAAAIEGGKPPPVVTRYTQFIATVMRLMAPIIDLYPLQVLEPLYTLTRRAAEPAARVLQTDGPGSARNPEIHRIEASCQDLQLCITLLGQSAPLFCKNGGAMLDDRAQWAPLRQQLQPALVLVECFLDIVEQHYGRHPSLVAEAFRCLTSFTHWMQLYGQAHGHAVSTARTTDAWPPFLTRVVAVALSSMNHAGAVGSAALQCLLSISATIRPNLMALPAFVDFLPSCHEFASGLSAEARSTFYHILTNLFLLPPHRPVTASEPVAPETVAALVGERKAIFSALNEPLMQIFVQAANGEVAATRALLLHAWAAMCRAVRDQSNAIKEVVLESLRPVLPGSVNEMQRVAGLPSASEPGAPAAEYWQALMAFQLQLAASLLRPLVRVAPDHPGHVLVAFEQILAQASASPSVGHHDVLQQYVVDYLIVLLDEGGAALPAIRWPLLRLVAGLGPPIAGPAPGRRSAAQEERHTQLAVRYTGLLERAIHVNWRWFSGDASHVRRLASHLQTTPGAAPDLQTAPAGGDGGTANAMPVAQREQVLLQLLGQLVGGLRQNVTPTYVAAVEALTALHTRVELFAHPAVQGSGTYATLVATVFATLTSKDRDFLREALLALWQTLVLVEGALGGNATFVRAGLPAILGAPETAAWPPAVRGHVEARLLAMQSPATCLENMEALIQQAGLWSRS